MAGRAAAVSSGQGLAHQVRVVGESLGLLCRSEVKVGRRLWGAVRRIDIVLTDPTTRRTLGVECKYQASTGTAEEKIPSTIQDIGAWPIPGIVVFDGVGFSPNMRAFLFSTGKAVEFCDLEDWLRLYFGIGNE